MRRTTMSTIAKCRANSRIGRLAIRQTTPGRRLHLEIQPHRAGDAVDVALTAGRLGGAVFRAFPARQQRARRPANWLAQPADDFDAARRRARFDNGRRCVRAIGGEAESASPPAAVFFVVLLANFADVAAAQGRRFGLQVEQVSVLRFGRPGRINVAEAAMPRMIRLSLTNSSGCIRNSDSAEGGNRLAAGVGQIPVEHFSAKELGQMAIEGRARSCCSRHRPVRRALPPAPGG